MLTKGEKETRVDDMHDHVTASHTTENPNGGMTTALSYMGMSPANMSMQQRKRQRSEAYMIDNFNTDAFSGQGNILHKYDSQPGVSNNRFLRGHKTSKLSNQTKLVSTRRTDPKARSFMPKNALNYYNLRKGLYLKNGGSRGASTQSRDNKQICSSFDNSVGVLNATPHNQQIMGDGISGKMGINSFQTSPKTVSNGHHV